MTLMHWYASWKKKVICLKQVAIFNGFFECFFSLQSLLLFLDMQCYTLIFMDFWRVIYILGRDIWGFLGLQKEAVSLYNFVWNNFYPIGT